MSKKSVIVVGAGLFGCVAAALARAEGHEVTLIGESRPYEASPASGCVLAPSWLSSLDKAQVATAMNVLECLYTVHDVEFQTILRPFWAKRVALRAVLTKPDIEGRVTDVGNGYVRLADGRKLQGVVLVCTGIWGQELVPSMPPVRGLYGASLRIAGQLPAPRLSVYAPYRQAVGFNVDFSHVWFGDGTALIEKTWRKEEDTRVTATVGRALKMLAGDTLKSWNPKVCVGARPYVEGCKGGYFERVLPKLWVSNGGAKNGTILAAWQASRFVREALK